MVIFIELVQYTKNFGGKSWKNLAMQYAKNLNGKSKKNLVEHPIIKK